MLLLITRHILSLAVLLQVNNMQGPTGDSPLYYYISPFRFLEGRYPPTVNTQENGKM